MWKRFIARAIKIITLGLLTQYLDLPRKKKKKDPVPEPDTEPSV